MTRKSISFVLILIFFCSSVPPAAAQYRRSYQIYLSLGQESLRQRDYRKAYFYFEAASRVDPSQEEAVRYLNLSKRLMEGRVRETPRPRKAVVFPSRKKAAVIPAPRVTMPLAGKGKAEPPRPAVSPKPVRKAGPVEEPVSRTIELDEALWATQPDTAIEIELKKSVILESQDIRQFLMVTPGAVAVQKTDSRHVVLTAQNRGASFFHLWQGPRRWTFRIAAVIPYNIVAASRLREQLRWERYEKPFTFVYNNDWSSLYRGKGFRDMERTNLNFRQWMGVFGQTPYGKLDGSVQLTKFSDSIEATGYGIGLTDAKIGPWKDFSVRGFDTSKDLSELSLPGKYFRGILLEGRAFARKLGYVYLQGQDRAVFSFLSSGVQQLQRSFVEGMSVGFYPDARQRYALNFARGFGEARPASLKDKVFSFTAQRQFGPLTWHSEVGYDEDVRSYVIRPEYRSGDLSWTLRFRDIDKDYMTINGPPGGQGEVGGLLTIRWAPRDFTLTSYLDLYRDRKLLNEEQPDAVNVDFNTSLRKVMGGSSKWQTDFYYFDTPGLLSMRRDVRIINSYDKGFDVFGGRRLTAILRQTYQRNRSASSPAAEFDRYAFSLGFQTMLIKNLSYYVSHEQSWVTDLFRDEKAAPYVLTTGLNYSRPLLANLSGYCGLHYRNEERTEKARSFLSGEDSLSGNFGLTYQPFPQLQVFMDGYVRNVWAENPAREDYKEAEVRVGCRYDWDLPLAWNPSALVTGTVYKDLNGNGLQDKDEEGLSDIRVKVGTKTVRTDAGGRYQRKVRAKQILVGLDVDSVPAGHVVTGRLTRELTIVHHERYQVNFGLTTQSGVYGVVFYDVNQNGSVDPGDEFIPNVKITLDGTQAYYTDGNGSYFFSQVAPGSHAVIVDLNTIPLSYLPTVKLKNEIMVTEGTTTIFNIPLKKK